MYGARRAFNLATLPAAQQPIDDDPLQRIGKFERGPVQRPAVSAPALSALETTEVLAPLLASVDYGPGTSSTSTA
jgi:hypothetical protein